MNNPCGVLAIADLEQVTVNFTGKTRKAKLNGRDYIVAPLSLIRTGVLNGSKGALFYPLDEIGKDPQRWNHTPIVVYHPVVNGQNVSARDPDVLNNSGIGIVLKSHVKNGKLKAEGWFDVAATRRIHPGILANLEAGKPIELSTGLFTTNEVAPQGSNYRGVSYDYIARDYVPDHLAILPDQIGACSINDGCGVLVNKDQTTANGGIGSGKAAVETSAKLGSEYLLEGSLIADTHLDKPRVSQGSILKAFQENGFVAKNNDPDGVVILASPEVITTKLQGKGWEHSHYQIKDGVRTDALSKGSNKITLTQQGAGKTVALATRQHQVSNQRGVSPLHSQDSGETMKKLTDDERFDLIEGIVGNCKCKAEEVNTLNELSDETLTAIATKFGPEDEAGDEEAPVKNEKALPKKKPVNNRIPQKFLDGKSKRPPVEEASDDEEEEAEGEQPVKNEKSRLTAEEQEDIAFARQMKLNQKNEKIKAITANSNNKFTKEELEAMPLNVLANMAELAKATETEVAPTANRRRSLYVGAAAPMSPQDKLTANAEQAKADIEAMRPPVINYSELAKEHRLSDMGRQRTVATTNMN